MRRVSDYDRQEVTIFINPQTWIKIHNTNKAGEESGTTCVYLGVCNQVNSYPEPDDNELSMKG